jgi:branched-chain amino acid aminotransferase
MPIATTASLSQTWTYFEDQWQEGNIPIMGPRTHAAWMASTVFDGGRVFEGVAPDIDLHLQRVNDSAIAFGLQPLVPLERWMQLASEGIAKFAAHQALYVRPMYWASDSGAGGGVQFAAQSTRWCLCIYEAPFGPPKGASITLSPYLRPAPEMAIVEAKAGSLYPNSGRALAEAGRRGFTGAIMRDPDGNIAELANANVFIAKDGVVLTPAPSGAFLAGITRARVIGLLREAGVEVREVTLRYEEMLEADEIFTAGNFNKVAPVNRIEDRDLQPGPLYHQARALYWAFAHSGAWDLQALARASA